MHIIEQLLESPHHFLSLLDLFIDVLIILSQHSNLRILFGYLPDNSVYFYALLDSFDVTAEFLDLGLESLVFEECSEDTGSLHLINFLDIVFEGSFQFGYFFFVLPGDLLDLFVELLLFLFLFLDVLLVFGEEVDLPLQGLLILESKGVQHFVGLGRLRKNLLVEFGQRLLRFLGEFCDIDFEFRGELLRLLGDVFDPPPQLLVLSGNVARSCCVLRLFDHF